MVVSRDEHRRTFPAKSPTQLLQERLNDRIEHERLKVHRKGQTPFSVHLNDAERNTDVWKPVMAMWEDGGWTVNYDNGRLDFS